MSTKSPAPKARKRGRPPLGAPVERKELERLYVKEGLTVAEVAQRLGTTPRRVAGMLLLSRGGQAPLLGSPQRRCVV